MNYHGHQDIIWKKVDSSTFKVIIYTLLYIHICIYN
jgi:hypothetical protein